MRMLFISNLYPPHHLGGYELLCHDVAGRLVARGHDVSVLTSTFRSSSQDQEPGVYRRLLLESDIYYYRPRQTWDYPKRRRTNLRALDEVLDAEKPDVVFVWGMWMLSQAIAGHAEKLMAGRVLYYLASEWPIEESSHEAYWDGSADTVAGRLFKASLRPVMRRALAGEWRPCRLPLQNVAVCCRFIQDHLLETGLPVENARVIYHGVDVDAYHAATKRRRAGRGNGTVRTVFVGSLLPHKGVHTAIEAMGRLARTSPSTPMDLTILGAGHPTYEEELRRLVQDECVADRVRFRQPIPRSQLPDFLADFDILVLPSIWQEPLALISEEAMAAGLVLVASDTGATPEIVTHGENGLLFRAEDAQELADDLRELAGNRTLRERLGDAAWHTASNRLTIAQTIDELESYAAEIASLRN